ncbi:MAG: RNA-binding transcriptional accessory protein, partial [Oscillospiraceae bacterium]|nr:RNA-binding transcriptional accessory protein [Oscillospiraceae bacterium]
METINQILARELNREQSHIDNVIALLDEGNTIPFIARYRKEMHGAMDDTALRTLAERLEYLRNLQERRDTVKKSITEQGKMTEELDAAIDAAATLAALEDIYRPYKPKRRTRATVAKEKGLEPLAELLYAQSMDCPAPEIAAADYVDAEKGVESVEEALAGASDIIAEKISDDADIRRILRELIERSASVVSVAATEEDTVYRLYYDFKQPVNKMQGHQVLAINRGEKEEKLKAFVELDRELALQRVRRSVIRPGSPAMAFVRAAADDAYDRLIWPSMERETRAALTDTACEGAIKMFGLNLKPLLMQPPVKGKVTMGLDPGYRNGCKVAVVDGTGKVLDTAVVYPTFSAGKKAEAIRILSALIRKHGVKHIAIGNGTASRETEQMTVEMLRELGGDLAYAIVNEAGASVYSASKLAAEEFPEFDVNLRSAVSIARRLQDPLAELVKIDPMAIGVGQYQHDMPQAKLEETLSGVVEDCVNAVGVDINTASPSLLQRVSGLTKTTAKNIVSYREENGVFTSRSEIKKVPKLGPKAFQQCAGFLRVPESKQVLDNTAVHPESYEAAKKLLELCSYSLSDVAAGMLSELPKRVEQIGAERAAEHCGVGVPTLRDIVSELIKPGRDPREELPPVLLRQDVLEIKDLKPGMVLTGTVRNVIDFGVFVDIGVHQDGLVHISQISSKF